MHRKSTLERGFVIGIGLTFLVATAVASSGCRASSRSSRSLASMLSVSASFKSSSAIFGDDDTSSPYARDVRSTTTAVVEAGADADDLLLQLGRVAELHGVSDWEGQPLTYHAVGAGLRSAGAEPSDARAFAEELTADPHAVQIVLLGYES